MQIHILLKLLFQSIFLGIFSTLFMDFSNFLGKALKVHKGGSYALIGRWIGGFFRGHFRYTNILQASPQPNEVYVGLVSHYCIGIFLAFLYLALGTILGISNESFVWAIGYGTFTNILPWFVMFPAFGFGILAMNSPAPNQLIKTSFLNHLGFGVALALGMKLWTGFAILS